MKRFFPLIVIFFASVAFSQTAGKAIPAYSVNDKLIGLSNLTDGLSECPVRSASGKIKDIDRLGNTVEIRIKIDKKTSAKAIIPLDRVSADERKPLFKHLITKNNIVRVAGYGCDAEMPFTAFSVDRVY